MRCIATAAGIAWLRAQGYRYLVVRRERGRRFDPEHAVQTLNASSETVRMRRVLSEDGAEVRLYCLSEGRAAKETAINTRFAAGFEAGLGKLAAGLAKPRGTKTLAAVQQRMGRLKEKSRGIGQHYEISATAAPCMSARARSRNRRCARSVTRWAWMRCREGYAKRPFDPDSTRL